VGELITTKTKAQTIRDLIDRQTANIKRVIPEGIRADRFARIALHTIAGNEKLLACTPRTLLGSLMQAAAFGLELDPAIGLAYLVPFKDTCQLIIGYQGLMLMALRSGHVTKMMARAVSQGDEFDYAYGLQEYLRHKPASVEIHGALTHVYATATLRPVRPRLARTDDGIYRPDYTDPMQFDVMSRAEVERIRERSRAAHSGPWVTDYEAMAKKTVVRRLSKFVPRSPELAKAIHLDEQVDRGEEQTFDVDLIDLPAELGSAPPDDRPALDKLAAQLPPGTTIKYDPKTGTAKALSDADLDRQIAHADREPGQEG
jgi:recombination protein RecT